MQSFTFHSQVNSDGILRLEIPVEATNTELQVTVTVEPVAVGRRCFTWICPKS
ncbi:hypothetical protein LAY41_06590 [Argonema galeatum A003/A1]|nr:hypothetical protein [Argonema galeatum A003/A1]